MNKYNRTTHGGSRFRPPPSDHPYELTDCDRIELELASRRRRGSPLPPRLAALSKQIERHIGEVGYSVFSVGTGCCAEPDCDGGEGGSPWSYTVGRTFFGLPELVTTGIGDWRTAVNVTNLVGLHSPWEQCEGMIAQVGAWRIRLDLVPPEWILADRHRVSLWFSGFAPFHRVSSSVPSLWQVVWSDEDGVFPNESGCDPVVAAAQPLLAIDPISYPPIDVDEAWIESNNP